MSRAHPVSCFANYRICPGLLAPRQKVLLHPAVGEKESTVCWKSFFEDLKQRGLAEPLLAIIDGNSGLRRAVRGCFPGSWVQRCQVHCGRRSKIGPNITV